QPDSLAMLRQQNLALTFNKLVARWPRRNLRYQDLQALLMQATEDHKKMHVNPDHLITRRDAVHFLALLPLEIAGLSARGAPAKQPPEETLTQCAAGITGCWYMTRGDKVFPGYIIRSTDLTAASDIIDTYIPTLKDIAALSSTQSGKAATDLLVQCFL